MISSGAIQYLKTARQKMLDTRPSAADFRNIYFSGTTFALWRVASAITVRFARGRVLDAGSGRGAWKAVIETAASKRETLDICEKPGEQLDWLADLANMPQVDSSRFDAVVCHQVLEHVPRPHQVISELARVLIPRGRLVLSVPHLSRLHDLPHDYFRYTEGGLRILLEDAGFEVALIRPYGGLMTFVHHQISTLILGALALTGPLYPVFVALNAPFSMLSAGFDRLIDRHNLAPNGYVVVARKRG